MGAGGKAFKLRTAFYMPGGGGGVAPKRAARAGTFLAKSHEAMPLVHTYVSRVSCPLCAICCNWGKPNGPCCWPFTEMWNVGC